MKNNCAVNETAKVLQLCKCSFERFAFKGEVKASKRRRGESKKTWIWNGRWESLVFTGNILAYLELVLLPYSSERYNCYSDRLHDFPVTILPRCYKDVFMSNVYFLKQ